MKSALLVPLLLGALVGGAPLAAQRSAPAPSPGEIVTAAPASAWIDMPLDDLLVMTLAPDARGKPRVAIIQLMPAPFSQGWVGNIKALARAHWWDGLSVYRVQDNYVTQWGDADGDDPARTRALPANLATMAEADYVLGRAGAPAPVKNDQPRAKVFAAYGGAGFSQGWPIVLQAGRAWPTHCYAMVGVARDLSPSTGTGAELYTVIGHAPRHLDRNIALVGRVVEGMEHLSSLPRGPAPLGVYADKAERTPIVSVRLASALPAAQQPRLQYLATTSASFARYADARADRRDPFFIVPAGGADICNIPVPIRRRP